VTRSERLHIDADGHGTIDGVSLDPAALARLSAMVDALEPAVEALYEVPEARDESPSTIFSARPPAKRWHG
jgi:hypothetical protein